MADDAESEVRDKGPRNTQPVEGKVQQIRQKFAVLEDGALAHKLQEKEFDRHYEWNNLKNRTARLDIPVDKLALKDEEIRKQSFMTPADADGEPRTPSSGLTDEEYAIALQEKDRQGYKRLLEKENHPKSRKPDRGARHHAGHTSGRTDGIEDGVGDLHIGGQGQNQREHPNRTITDGGNFFELPDHLDPAQQRILQEKQDEELARQLQEKEQRESRGRGRGRGGRRGHNHSENYQGARTDPDDTVGPGSYQFS